VAVLPDLLSYHLLLHMGCEEREALPSQLSVEKCSQIIYKEALDLISVQVVISTGSIEAQVLPKRYPDEIF